MTRALLVASVANLKPARLLAFDDDLAMLRAQFDLANVAGVGPMTIDHMVWPRLPRDWEEMAREKAAAEMPDDSILRTS